MKRLLPLLGLCVSVLAKPRALHHGYHNTSAVALELQEPSCQRTLAKLSQSLRPSPCRALCNFAKVS